MASANSRIRHLRCRRPCCHPHRVPCTICSTGTASRSTEAAVRSTSVRCISSACPAVRRTGRLGGKSACWQPAKPGPCAHPRHLRRDLGAGRGHPAGASLRSLMTARAKRAGAVGRPAWEPCTVRHRSGRAGGGAGPSAEWSSKGPGPFDYRPLTRRPSRRPNFVPPPGHRGVAAHGLYAQTAPGPQHFTAVGSLPGPSRAPCVDYRGPIPSRAGLDRR